MKLVTKNHEMSDEFRKGLWDAKKRIASVLAPEQSEHELLGLIFVFEAVLALMKSKLSVLRANRRKNFKLNLIT